MFSMVRLRIGDFGGRIKIRALLRNQWARQQSAIPSTIRNPDPKFKRLSSKTATPGKSMPSKNSRLAPPPVETWEI